MTGTDAAEEESRAIATAISGSMAATIGSTVIVFEKWRRSGDLWRIRQRMLAHDQNSLDNSYLRDEMVQTMTQVPVPNLLYRTVTRERSLGAVSVKPGERVVVSLGSTAFDDRSHSEPSERWLFGGIYGGAGETTNHPCPGREMAMGMMLGILHTILTQKDLREEGGVLYAPC